MDTWILLSILQSSGERNRLLYLLKSRGMAHSNQVREFVLTNHGIELTDVYVGPGTVLTGAARLQQEARDLAGSVEQKRAFEVRQRELEQQRVELQAQLESLRLRLESVEKEQAVGTAGERNRQEQLSRERRKLEMARYADSPGKGKK
jgi:circadian clock protein KaiC